MHARALVRVQKIRIKGGYGYLHVYEALYGGKPVDEFFAGERDGLTGFSGASRSSDPVDIGLRIHGHVVIHDHVQGVYVEPAGGHVGSH